MIAFLLIATGRYKEFVPALARGLELLFPDRSKKIVLMSDQELVLCTHIPILWHRIERKGFPGDTLFRYHYFLECIDMWSDVDFVMYLDVDMRIEKSISFEDMMGPAVEQLVAVRHPGFARFPKQQEVHGTPELRPESTSCLSNQVLPYVCGGVQGGSTRLFRDACQVMKHRIDTDLRNNIVPVWHDESVWNKYVNDMAAVTPESVNVLSPAYCYTPAYDIMWDLRQWTPVISCIEKNHVYYRSE